MGAELARVRFIVAALKSGDSSYPKFNLDQAIARSPTQPVWTAVEHFAVRSVSKFAKDTFINTLS